MSRSPPAAAATTSGTAAGSRTSPATAGGCLLSISSALLRARSVDLDSQVLAVVDVESVWVGVGAARPGTRTDCEHVWFETQELAAGAALPVRTHQGDVRELRSHGDPSWNEAGETGVEAAQRLWESLDVARRVLVVAIDLRTGQAVVLDQQDPTRPRDLEV